MIEVPRRKRGVTLPVTLMALALMGTLVAMAFHTAHLEHRLGRNSMDAAVALGAAEAGISMVIGDWSAHPQLGSLAVNETVTLPIVRLKNGVVVASTVVRLTEGLYFVRADGMRADRDGGVLAKRTITVIARAVPGGAAPLLQRSWAQP